jgi:ribonuclease T1
MRCGRTAVGRCAVARRRSASRSTGHRSTAAVAVVVLAVVAALVWHAASGSGSIRTVRLDQLPSEVRATLLLVERGGPFPYEQDGVVFDNREGRLPSHHRGYYHEYTVPTPGSPDRGARRLVVGARGEDYYTSDHYNSFRRITR